MEWQRDGIGEPTVVVAATAEYRESQDAIGNFLAEHCAVGPAFRTKATPLYERYKSWAEKAGERPQAQRGFGESMTERGFQRYANNGIWYSGVGLRDETDDGKF